MTKTRRRWEPAPLPMPKRPFRDSVVFYAVLSGIIILVAWLTGGRLLPGDIGDREVGAIVVAAVFFVAATTWSWWRFSKRLAAEANRRSDASRR